MIEKSLKEKSIKGVFWNLIEKFGIQFIKLTLGIILARLLTPKDYGLIGMVTVFFVVAQVFIDSGFGYAYIQKKNANEVDASTIFFFNFLVSIAIYILLWFFAPIIARFYSENQLIVLIRTMSVVIIINSFSVIQISKLTKDVNFRNKTIILLISAIVAGSAGIVTALLNYGVWSLVVQGIVRASLTSLGLWIAYKWKPLWIFSLQSLRSMFSFSYWVLLTSIIRTVFDNIYTLTIGKFFPMAELGFYTKAKSFQSIVSQQPSQAIGAVAFPVFSQLQDDKNDLKKAMRKFSRHTLFFVAPISAILIVIAKPMFLVLLTEKWLPMVPYFQFLCIAGLLYPIHLMNVLILTAQGKTNLNFLISMIKNSLRIINLAIMYRFGVVYIIYGEIIVSLIALIINSYFTKKFINYGVFEQLKDLLSIILASGFLTCIGLLIQRIFASSHLQIIIGVLLIGGLYLFIMFFFERLLLFENVEILRNKIIKSK